MDIFKIVSLGIAAAVLAVFIREWRKEIALLISLLTVTLIFFAVIPNLKTVFEVFRNISEKIGLNEKYITIVLKVIGIAYVTQFGAELCRDAGETAVASKIEFGGKIMIVALSIPVLYSFLEVVESVINYA